MWWTIEADDQSSLHPVIVLTDVMSDHIEIIGEDRLCVTVVV